jgi:hypothetical protein
MMLNIHLVAYHRRRLQFRSIFMKIQFSSFCYTQKVLRWEEWKRQKRQVRALALVSETQIGWNKSLWENLARNAFHKSRFSLKTRMTTFMNVNFYYYFSCSSSAYAWNLYYFDIILTYSFIRVYYSSIDLQTS